MGRFDPVAWAAYLLVVLVHEGGHAFLVRRCRLGLLSIDVHGLGGVCRYSPYATGVQRSKIAWGGVLAQGAMLLLTDSAVRVVPALTYGRLASTFQSFAVMNFALIVLNLLPIRGFDGAEAWKLFPWSTVSSWFRRGRARVRSNDQRLRD